MRVDSSLLTVNMDDIDLVSEMIRLFPSLRGFEIMTLVPSRRY